MATWVRESESLWAFPTVLTVHTIGLSIVVGVSVAIALRILGFAPRVPLRPLERLFPLLWIGFWINAASGVLLFMAKATSRATQPIFWIKLAFILISVGLIQWLRRFVFRDSPTLDADVASGKGKAVALASIVAWIGAITAGRLMAYFE